MLLSIRPLRFRTTGAKYDFDLKANITQCVISFHLFSLHAPFTSFHAPFISSRFHVILAYATLISFSCSFSCSFFSPSFYWYILLISFAGFLALLISVHLFDVPFISFHCFSMFLQPLFTSMSFHVTSHFSLSFLLSFPFHFPVIVLSASCRFRFASSPCCHQNTIG